MFLIAPRQKPTECVKDIQMYPFDCKIVIIILQCEEICLNSKNAINTCIYVIFDNIMEVHVTTKTQQYQQYNYH